MSEQKIQQEIRLQFGVGDTRLFRNNTGTLRDDKGRPVQFGLCKGSADLIGWKTIEITQEMVGQKIAQFVSIEVKTPTGTIRPDQRVWYEAVKRSGGIACIARSLKDAEAALRGCLSRSGVL